MCYDFPYSFPWSRTIGRNYCWGSVRLSEHWYLWTRLGFLIGAHDDGLSFVTWYLSGRFDGFLLCSLVFLVYSVNDAVLMSLCPTDIHMTRCRGHLASIVFYLFLYDEESMSWNGISKHCLLFLESSILFQHSL